MSGDSPFSVEKEGHVAWLILNRPENRNTLNQAFFEEFHGHFEEFDADPEVRVVVIKAEGKSFCAGLDLVDMAPILQGDGAYFREDLRRKFAKYEDSFCAVERCSKPVIAAVHSHCIGGGVGFVSACDIRLASRDAVFSIRQTRVAFIPDLGIIRCLPHIIGQGWLRELALTGRDFSAEEALKMGFITELCEDREDLYSKAGRLASQIADLPPLAVQAAKDVILHTRDYGGDSGTAYLVLRNADFIPSEDLKEAFQAFAENRKPVFKGR